MCHSSRSTIYAYLLQDSPLHNIPMSGGARSPAKTPSNFKRLSTSIHGRHGHGGQRRFTRRRRPVDSSEKRFQCTYEGCGLTYYRRDNMVRHQIQKHNQKVTTLQ